MHLRMLIKGKTLFSLALFILLTVSQVQAAVTVDNRSSGGFFSNTGTYNTPNPQTSPPSTTVTWQHTVGGGMSRALVVAVSTTSQAATSPACTDPSGSPITCPALPDTGLTGSTAPVLSVTYNGTPLTLVENAGNASAQVSVWQLTSPAEGSGNITVSLIPGVATHVVGNAVSFTEVDQAAPVSVLTQAANTSGTSVGFSGSGAFITTDDMGFDAVSITPNGGYLAPSAGQTVCTDPADETTCTRGRRFFSFAYDVGAAGTKQADAGSVSLGWNWTTSSPYAYIAALINAAPPASAAMSSISGQVLTAEGKPIALAHVTLQNLATGESFYSRTDRFGRYRFDALESAQTYQMRINSRLYSFTPDSRIFNLIDSLTNLDFVAVSRKQERRR